MGNILNKAGLEHLAEVLDEKYGNPHIPQALVKTTYAELKALRDGGKLVAGTWYRITDYECTTTQENTRSAGHRFDVIVLALDNKTLSEEARACINEEYEQSMIYVDDGDHCVYTGEVFTVTDANGRTVKATFFRSFDYSDVAGYFITGDIADWKARTAVGIWINVQDSGVIDTENKTAVSNTDELTSEVWVDFASTSFGYFSDCKLEAWKIWYCIDNDKTRFAWADTSGKGVIYRMIDEWNNDVPYDFKNIQFVRTTTDGIYDKDGEETYVYTFELYDQETYTHYDASTSQFVIYNDEGGYSHTYGNVIKQYGEGGDHVTSYGSPRVLNDIVFLNVREDGDFYYGCDSNTFGNYCHSNTFGNYCHSNTFGNGCNSNTFGNNFHSNTFGNNFHSNTFGNYCHSNTFGNGCNSNTFGNDCNSNTFFATINKKYADGFNKNIVVVGVIK